VNALPLRLVRLWERLRYDRYWRSRASDWSYGINIIDQAISSGLYRTVLDAGCGRGDVVAHLLRQGYQACGVELSAHAVSHGVVKTGEVMQGSLDKLPFPDRSFDLVFSSEVLEHIAADRIPVVVRELVRICRTRLFLTISLRPSSQNNAFHVTLHPRHWWEDQFLQAGVHTNRTLVDRWQQRGPFTNREVLERGPASAIIDEMETFITQKPYSFCGELEPWYFVFDR
jgi:SAM-dependent methyltransferase